MMAVPFQLFHLLTFQPHGTIAVISGQIGQKRPWDLELLNILVILQVFIFATLCEHLCALCVTEYRKEHKVKCHAKNTQRTSDYPQLLISMLS
jgi:hypothetical protein